MEDKCKRCAYKYGTLACCTTVSNKWVYSCKEGMAKYKEKQEKKYSVLVDIDTSDAFYQEFTDKKEADKIFNRFLTTLNNDEDDTQEEIEEEEDVWTHTVRLYLFENGENVVDYCFDISDDICCTRGYYEELL